VLIKVYQFEFPNSWPYAKDVAVRVAVDHDPIGIAVASADQDRMDRTYRRFPDQHVSWAFIEGFDPYDHAPESFAARVGEIWVQIEYSLYSSRHRADDARLERLRRTLREDGINALPFPPELRPDEHHIGTYKDAFHTLRLEGTVSRQPFHVLYVSELGDIPIINDHTIPEDIDFAWVDAQVVTFGRYDALPTYQELLDRLDRYCGIFDGWFDQASPTAALLAFPSGTGRKRAKPSPKSRRDES
jgi:hypothetical protein